MNFGKKHRREPLELQLTAMIDIFTMIVIFLVMGTVIGVADVTVPKGAKLPKSSSVESLDAAPQVIFNTQDTPNGKITTTIELKAFSAEMKAFPPIAVEDFRPRMDDGKNAKIEDLKVALRKTISRLSSEQRKGGVLLNVVADQATSYRDLYDVVKVFREAGFESLLFVASGDKKLGKGDKDAASAGASK